jgi:tetratricopeptide (TPR) repeat protein
MSMDSDSQRIVELFGLLTPELPDEETPEADDSRIGRDTKESTELGERSLREGDFQRAAEHYRRALNQSDDDPTEALLGLGSALECLEQSPQALRQYEKAVRIRRDNPEPYLGLSEVYKRHGRVRESIEHLKEAVRLEPTNGLYHLKLAEVLRSTGERKHALRAIQSAVLTAPDNPFFHYWMGDLLIEMKEPESALESLRAAIELSPKDDLLFVKAGIAFWQAGRAAEAIKAVRLASDLNPDKLVHYGLLERFLRADGQAVEADLEQKRASEMDAYDCDLVDRLCVEAGLRI